MEKSFTAKNKLTITILRTGREGRDGGGGVPAMPSYGNCDTPNPIETQYIHNYTCVLLLLYITLHTSTVC